MAKLSKPFPPGRYPLIVVGSGPGALQTSYFLRRRGVKHAVLSADPAPGGMFRRFPFFDRLISWSKPYAPVPNKTSAYERYDWNSLWADEVRNRSLVPRFMDGTSYFPRRSEMEQGMVAFAEKTRLRVRYGCRWEATSRSEDRFVLHTSDGDYSAPLLIFATGVAKPWVPEFPGRKLVHHYADLKPPRRYAGQRVFILGKRNSAFETAHGLLPWASRIVMASPSPVKFSFQVRHVSAARAVYIQPYEDYVLGGGHYVIDGVPERIERNGDAYRVHVSGTTVPGNLVFDADDVVAATGFEACLGDLPELGLRVVSQQRVPYMDAFWESSIPGIFFAGSAMQGSPGLRKYGRASSSGVVRGFRPNARVLADHIAERHFGIQAPATKVPAREVVGSILATASEEGSLWNQQAYLGRVITFDARRGAVDIGLQPLAHFVDSPGPDAVAVTVETDDSGDVHPAVYVRRRSKVTEHLLSTGPLLDFRTKENRAQLTSLVASLRG